MIDTANMSLIQLIDSLPWWLCLDICTLVWLLH